MKIKVSEASSVQLDWMVAKCEGEPYSAVPTTNGIGMDFPATNYSTDWAQGGPIIEKVHMEFDFECIDAFGRHIACAPEDVYRAKCQPDDAMMPTCAKGPTHLIAAMRCYVASKLGDEVEVPDELS